MKQHLITLAIAGSLLLGAAPTMAATSYEPGIDWRTIETPHFRVNYPADLEEIGRRVAAYAEDAHAKVAPFMKADTYEKTEIVCFDTYDDTNANASNYPHNRILLNLHPPSPDVGLPVGRHDDWIRFVVLHEYTHILHQNHTHWGINQLNRVLGKIFFQYLAIPGVPSFVTEYLPTLLSDSPRFITEGWAVHTESRFTPGGRGKEGYGDMRLRMATLDRKLHTLDQVNGSYLLDWPAGGNEYDYGTAFFQYLSATYGEEVPTRILEVFGRMPWLGIDFAVSQVLKGKTCATLWDETMGWLHQRYANQAREIRQQPLTASKALTSSGRYHHHPRWLADGSLLFTESYKGKGSMLVKRTPSGATQSVMSVNPLGHYSVSEDGRSLYYAVQSGDETSFKSYSDLYRLDVATGKSKRLTEDMRAADPALSPDGKQLVAVVTQKGTNHLVLLDAEGKVIKALTAPTSAKTYANPAWSPDGKRIVASRWVSGGYQIVLVDPETGEEVEVTPANALDFYPSFTPDGQHILFTSDRSGVFNLYAVRLADKALFQVSNVMGGAFQGRVAPDGKALAFVNYGSGGFDLHEMPFEPASWRSVSPDMVLASNFEGQFVPYQSVAPTPVDMSLALSATPRSYNPWPSIAPNALVPLIAQDEGGLALGVSAFGQDVLRQHTYNVLAGAGLSSGKPIAGFVYQNDQLQPSLSMMVFRAPGASAYPLVINNQLTFGRLWQDQTLVDLNMRLPGIPFPLLGASWVTGDSYVVGYRAQHAQNYALSTVDRTQLQYLTGGDPNTLPRFELAADPGQTNSLYAMFQRADNFTRSYGVSPEGGSLSTLGYEKASPMLGGQANFDRVWGDYRRYVSLPWQHHVLALRGSIGLNWGKNGGHFFVGGVDAPHFLSQVDLTAATDVFHSSIPMRGYSVAGIGNKVALLSAEYRFPLLEVNKGLWTLPFYMDRLYGVVGYDVSNTWDSPFNANRQFQASDTLHGASLELRSKLTLFRYLRTDFRLGVAQGLATTATTQPSRQLIMGFGSTF
jgi:Tol biopolymer transport system component